MEKLQFLNFINKPLSNRFSQRALSNIVPHTAAKLVQNFSSAERLCQQSHHRPKPVENPDATHMTVDPNMSVQKEQLEQAVGNAAAETDATCVIVEPNMSLLCRKSSWSRQ